MEITRVYKIVYMSTKPRGANPVCLSLAYLSLAYSYGSFFFFLTIISVLIRYLGSRTRTHTDRRYIDFGFKNDLIPSTPKVAPPPAPPPLPIRPDHGKRGDTWLHAFQYPVPTSSPLRVGARVSRIM